MDKELREQFAGIDFCWATCGEVALICKKQSECAAFEDRKNKSYSHPTLDYRKPDQILALVESLIKQARKEVAEWLDTHASFRSPICPGPDGKDLPFLDPMDYLKLYSALKEGKLP